MNWIMIFPMVMIGIIALVSLIAFIISLKQKEPDQTDRMLQFALFMTFFIMVITEYIFYEIAINTEAFV